jgi:hypothetical protein
MTFAAIGILGGAIAVSSQTPGVGTMEITRSTIDGGGLMFSTGGDFELSGTIGQPDAGVMAGDNFELTGGFWFQTPPSDCDNDGGVSLLDHASFTECLSGPESTPADAHCRCFDVDFDGDVDAGDFALLQATFTSP